MRISDWSSDVCSSDLAAGVHLYPRGAGLADQALVEGLFKPVLADLEPGEDQQRVLPFLILFRPRRPHIATQVRDRRPIGPNPGVTADRLTPRELRPPDVACGELAPAHTTSATQLP